MEIDEPQFDQSASAGALASAPGSCAADRLRVDASVAATLAAAADDAAKDWVGDREDCGTAGGPHFAPPLLMSALGKSSKKKVQPEYDSE